MQVPLTLLVTYAFEPVGDLTHPHMLVPGSLGRGFCFYFFANQSVWGGLPCNSMRLDLSLPAELQVSISLLLCILWKDFTLLDFS